MKTLVRSAIAGAVALAFNTPAVADPAAGSAYFTDRQESFVFDQTSEKINTVNMITCFIDMMNPDELVNDGNYIALVDMNRCDSSRRSDTSRSTSTGGADAATDYMRATVNSTRASSSAAMRVKGWVEGEGEGGRQEISLNISVGAAPSDTNPYGEFRMDYKGIGTRGTNPPSEQMRGFLSGASTGIQWAEREVDSGGGGVINNKRLYLTKSGETGAGAVEERRGTDPAKTFRFAYNATHFRRAEVGGADRCFDRALSNADASVWRYGLYDASGARVERNSGFPIEFATGERTYNGYAGFWGVHLPPDAMAALTSGSTVSRRAFGEGATATTTYSVLRSRGRLMKWQRRSATLPEFSNSRFTLFPYAGLSDATAGAVVSGATAMTIRGYQLEAYWDQAASAFKIAGVQSCGDGGCRTAALATPVSLTNADLALYSMGLHGWSQTFGGPVGIPDHVIASIAAGSPAGSVNYRSQDVVFPGTAGAPTTLYCASNCPTAASLAAYFTSGGSPFGATGEHGRDPSSTVTYTLNPTTADLEVGGVPAVVASTVTESSVRGTPYQWGIRSGKLVSTLSDLECAPSSGTYCDMRAENLDTYYTWETGPNNWNQFIGLSAGGTPVRFDPPLQLNYMVPDLARFGEFRGRTVVLQYEGFGNLHGIPGHCVDPRTNLAAACGEGMRYVARFAIPYDDTPDPLSPNTATDASGARYYVKWLNREVRFAQADASACSALALGDTSSLPDVSSYADPTEPSSATYIGPKPTVTAAPRVIDGVTMY